MPASGSPYEHKLDLRVGELVEVRSEKEILRTLDSMGRLDALPFMPEMLQFCGKRFRVYRRADKTCDTIHNTGIRRLKDCVHLEDLRCEGEAHGDCQARCLLFWKEAWLKRGSPRLRDKWTALIKGLSRTETPGDSSGAAMRCTLVNLQVQTRGAAEKVSTEIAYSCQATELFRATTALSASELRPYLRDLFSGNVSMGELLYGVLFAGFRKLARIGGYRILVKAYDRVQKIMGGCPYPYKQGTLRTTPTATLNLQPGELIQVKNHEEILKTVDTRNRNRGLSFDVEMVRYCGGQYRVLRRVEKIINERTGKMIRFSAPPVMLEGVTCRSQFSEGKLFCPRSIHSYWREIWLQRVEPQ